MKKRFTVTYDIVTEESARHADYAESGFVFPDGDHIEVAEAQAELGANWRNQWPPQFAAMTLAQAVCVMGMCEDCGRGDSFYECDGRDDYVTGANERRAVHYNGKVTAASAARLRRVFCGR